MKMQIASNGSRKLFVGPYFCEKERSKRSWLVEAKVKKQQHQCYHQRHQHPAPLEIKCTLNNEQSKTIAPTTTTTTTTNNTTTKKKRKEERPRNGIQVGGSFLAHVYLFAPQQMVRRSGSSTLECCFHSVWWHQLTITSLLLLSAALFSYFSRATCLYG